jgi:hypothetical protein
MISHMEHYVRPDANDPPPATLARPEPLHRRIVRLLSALVADRQPSRRQPSNVIRNHDGTSMIISSNHGGYGGGA